MKDRIKEIRKVYGLTQAKFAESIGLTRNYIAQVEMGVKNCSDRTVMDICRTYHINKEWLIDGSGEMVMSYDDDADLAAMLGDLMSADDDDDDLKTRKKRFINTLLRMTPDEWDILLRLAEALK